MSDLEQTLIKELFETNSPQLGPKNSEQIAHWFMKTAVLFNVSQPTKLCWTATDRNRLRYGPIRNASVFLFRTERSTLNWHQGGVSLAAIRSDWCSLCVSEYLALTHQIAIQVGQYIGLVIYKPWQIANSEITSDGLTLWDRNATIPNWNNLKVVKDIFDLKILFQLRDSGFFRLHTEEFCAVQHELVQESMDMNQLKKY